MLAGIGMAGELAAPQGGFAYYEVTLENLTNTLESLAMTTESALNRLSTSLSSLANVVRRIDWLWITC